MVRLQETYINSLDGIKPTIISIFTKDMQVTMQVQETLITTTILVNKSEGKFGDLESARYAIERNNYISSQK